MSQVPLIGVSACSKQIGLHPFHTVGDKYVRAVHEAGCGLPLIIPALGQALDIASLVETLDGLLLTGSPSNVEAHHYQALHHAASPTDVARDSTTLPLIHAAIQAGVPILGICRGFQELNVPLGGSLHQNVHEQPGLFDHRENPEGTLDQQYDLKHSVAIEPGGLLASLGLPAHILVNSLHGQGIARLADSLQIEARAEDGLIEAVSSPSASSWVLGVQWHPEWKVLQNPNYLAIFKAFGEACQIRRNQRLQRSL